MTDFKPQLAEQLSVIADRVSIASYTGPNVIVVVCTSVPEEVARNKLQLREVPDRTFARIHSRMECFHLVELQTD